MSVAVPPNRLQLLFLGSGTSAGIPMIGCDCAVCTSADPLDQRTRTSVVISYGDTRVLVDTTPELRLQALANKVHRIDAVVFTHAHADHIMGLDDVRRYNYVKGGPLDVFADKPTHDTLVRCFGYAFKEPAPEQKVFRPHLIHREITGEFEIAGVTWTPIPLLHGDMPVLGFRVGNLAYCTDVSRIPESSYKLLEGLDVLILDALQKRKHTTHFNLEEAIEESKKIAAKRTLFTHIAHGLGHAATNAELPERMELAYDGLVVEASL
ncbi:MBL fold metallo-hydrolase [Humisphaera borealis]|uniref:MBL fold metallo-hydrolase n=1 Tax=Humisphaera borealis TaxID=2807512 RepID=A0A7M2WUZ5_9BACT|nr:MBL fold metallo-hydrolase [Humisphaera borealis]QOV89243.1 MBL fold metallo-hydrolase [Humisphaera borealis]